MCIELNLTIIRILLLRGYGYRERRIIARTLTHTHNYEDKS